MTSPRPPAAIPEAAPPEALRRLRAWLCWRYLPPERDGAKWRKVPFYAAGGARKGEQGTDQDCSQLVDYDTALAAAAKRGMAGVGLAMLGHGVSALDWDDCVTDSVVAAEVERFAAGTYAEFSPSGNGVRAFVLGSLGDHKSKGLEVFDAAGFVTYTGRVLPVCELTDCAQTIAEPAPALREHLQARFAGRSAESVAPSERDPLGLSDEAITAALAALPDDLCYDDWLKVGMAVHHETAGEGFDVWDTWSTKSPKYNGSEYGQARWDSFGRRSSGPTATMDSLRALGAAVPIPNEFEDLPDEPASEVKPEGGRFRVISLDEFAERPPLRWIVKGLIPATDLVFVYGESGAGKSFAVLDICAAVARGIAWRELKTAQGGVVYIAAEGAAGFRGRIEAYRKVHNLALHDIPLGVIPEGPDLRKPADIKALAREVLRWGSASIVVVDTLAQATPGANENASEDMGLAIKHCKDLHRLTGATILLVHHAGKDGKKGLRGWSGLKGAADAEIEVTRGPAGRAIRCSKQKDGKDGATWGFELTEIVLGLDEDGDAITSCVVSEAQVPSEQQTGEAKVKRSVNQARLMEVIDVMAQERTTGIPVETVMLEALRRWPQEEGKRDTRRQRLADALRALTTGEDAPYSWEGDALSIL